MKFEFSAGGIVFKKPMDKEAIAILLCQHSQHHGWVFPKGIIGDNIEGESKESTALREVEEETGVKGIILEPLPPISYWYMWEKEKRKKTVYYYIMSFAGGDITKHDHEMETVEFLPIADVANRLSFPSDKKIWKEAKHRIEKRV